MIHREAGLRGEQEAPAPLNVLTALSFDPSSRCLRRVHYDDILKSWSPAN
uniref:Uncharacterized protein n=1 Tax=Anguilla anguilla TaxID=7936 RepID=A0A0E9QIQ2_ANGAN